MTEPAFVTDADLAAPTPALACGCARHRRRLFAAALLAGVAMPALAQSPTPAAVCKRSWATNLAPASQVEEAAATQYRQLLGKASAQRALAPENHPQLVRLRAVAERLRPHATACNVAARDWRWEVNLIGDRSLNAFCMPGGKIAFFWGILAQLQLDDDEVAMIMGHEMAHALLEHARERMGKTAATRIGAGVLSALLGLGGTGDALLNMGGQLLTLKFSRQDETEADVVGLELAARGGYDPRAGVSLWRKMMAAAKGAPPEFLSTHPAGDTRIAEIEQKLPGVLPVFERAAKPVRRFEPPPPAKR